MVHRGVETQHVPSRQSISDGQLLKITRNPLRWFGFFQKSDPYRLFFISLLSFKLNTQLPMHQHAHGELITWPVDQVS